MLRIAARTMKAEVIQRAAGCSAWMKPANRVENPRLSRGFHEQIPAPAETFGSHARY
jgi:hypothetical protein